MKYKLLKELPFMPVHSTFGTGWAGSRYGIDNGTSVSSSHNGVTIFTEYQNKVLEDILDNPK